MAAFDYSRALATANRLIGRFGRAGKVRRPSSSGPAYNPMPGLPDDHDAVFAVFAYEVKDVDGARILATDKKVLLAVGTLPIEPTTSDLLVEADGGVFRIIDLNPLKPGPQVVFYWVQVRR